MEQSIPPFERYLSGFAAACQMHLSPVAFHPEYVVIVRDVMSRLWKAQMVDDGGTYLGPLPELGEQFFVKGEEDYAMYSFIKARVAQGFEWDEAGYLRQHPQLMAELEGQERGDALVDGLHHFLGHQSLQAAGELCCWQLR